MVGPGAGQEGSHRRRAPGEEGGQGSPPVRESGRAERPSTAAPHATDALGVDGAGVVEVQKRGGHFVGPFGFGWRWCATKGTVAIRGPAQYGGGWRRGRGAAAR